MAVLLTSELGVSIFCCVCLMSTHLNSAWPNTAITSELCIRFCWNVSTWLYMYLKVEQWYWYVNVTYMIVMSGYHSSPRTTLAKRFAREHVGIAGYQTLQGSQCCNTWWRQHSTRYTDVLHGVWVFFSFSGELRIGTDLQAACSTIVQARYAPTSGHSVLHGNTTPVLPFSTIQRWGPICCGQAAQRVEHALPRDNDRRLV